MIIQNIKTKNINYESSLNANIDEQMISLLASKKCDCGGQLKQARSGSKVAYCENCNQRFEAKNKTK